MFKADNRARKGYSSLCALAGRANSRRYQSRRRSKCDRILCGPGLCDGENQHGGSYGEVKEADSWSTGGGHAPGGPGGVLAETLWDHLPRRLAELTSEHECGFDSRAPLHLTPPGQFLSGNAFHILQREDEENFNGDYPTKRTGLEIYDALAESRRIGHHFYIPRIHLLPNHQ